MQQHVAILGLSWLGVLAVFGVARRRGYLVPRFQRRCLTCGRRMTGSRCYCGR